MSAPSADIYTEFSGFAGLRAQARDGSADARLKVAEQVEGLFMSLVLKSMREAGQAFGDTVGGTEQSLYDAQLAVEMSKGGKLGFAQTMFGTPPSQASAHGAREFAVPARNMSLPARDWVAVRSAAAGADAAGPELDVAPTPSAASVPAAAQSSPGAQWDSPQSFARELWPAASRAAQQLGTRPEAVLAVAALETGWGKHMPSNADGTLSNNLFGIKAHGWRGAVTHSSTLEFENGRFARRVEPFRAYASAEDAVADFANFVSTQPRYEEALRNGHDPVKFVHALQAAGYATDPRYGDKLEALLNGPVLKQAAADAGVPASAALNVQADLRANARPVAPSTLKLNT